MTSALIARFTRMTPNKMHGSPPRFIWLRRPQVPPLAGHRRHHKTRNLTYVNNLAKLTYMEKTQIYLRREELDALRKAAARSGRSVAELVRDAIRKVVLKPRTPGPVAIWDGEPKRVSINHDSVHDQT